MRKKGFRYSETMRIIQHILAAFVVFIIIYSVVGTSVVINSAGKDVSYNLYESDKSRSYEESYLFNNILGNNMSNVLRKEPSLRLRDSITARRLSMSPHMPVREVFYREITLPQITTLQIS